MIDLIKIPLNFNLSLSIVKYITNKIDKNSFEESLKKENKEEMLNFLNNNINQEKQFSNNIDNFKIEPNKNSIEFWKQLIKRNFKSCLLKGKQGSGKTFLAKQIASTAEKEGFKIIYIKSWDYDYENKPFLLILKKIFNANILKDEDQQKLYLYILLYENQQNLSISQHLLIDIAKKFLFETEVDEDIKVLFIVDELERCQPKFAIELLEAATTFLGVEKHIDKNNYNKLENNKINFLIKKIKILWVFDKEILDKVVCNIYNTSNEDKRFLKRYWAKYYEFEENTFILKSYKVFNILKKIDKNNIKYYDLLSSVCEGNSNLIIKHDSENKELDIRTLAKKIYKFKNVENVFKELKEFADNKKLEEPDHGGMGYIFYNYMMILFIYDFWFEDQTTKKKILDNIEKDFFAHHIFESLLTSLKNGYSDIVQKNLKKNFTKINYEKPKL